MLKKIIFLFLLIPTLSCAIYEVDMTMDRPYTTDMAIQASQVYYKAINPTRPCVNCPRRMNRWARCNKKNLKVDPALLDAEPEDDSW